MNTLFAANEYLTSYSTFKFPLIFCRENKIASYIAQILHFLPIDLALPLREDSTHSKPPVLGLHLSRS